MNIETLIGFGRSAENLKVYTGKILSIIPFAWTPSENEQRLVLVQEFDTEGFSLVCSTESSDEEFKVPRTVVEGDAKALVDFLETSLKRGIKPTFGDATVSNILHELITTIISKFCGKNNTMTQDKELTNTLLMFSTYERAYKTVEMLVKENGASFTEENVRDIDEAEALEVMLKKDATFDLKYLLKRETVEYGKFSDIVLATRFIELLNMYARLLVCDIQN